MCWNVGRAEDGDVVQKRQKRREPDLGHGPHVCVGRQTKSFRKLAVSGGVGRAWPGSSRNQAMPSAGTTGDREVTVTLVAPYGERSE